MMAWGLAGVMVTAHSCLILRPTSASLLHLIKPTWQYSLVPSGTCLGEQVLNNRRHMHSLALNITFASTCYRYDFFVVSQAVRQGTVAPTHYNIISDSSTLKPDHFQRLTYKLCHLYYNWPVSWCNGVGGWASDCVFVLCSFGLCTCSVSAGACSLPPPSPSGHHPCPCSLPVCPQAGFPGGTEHPPGAQSGAGRSPLLPVEAATSYGRMSLDS